MAAKKNVEVETKEKAQELKAKQIWQEAPHENPFQKQRRALISDMKANASGVFWVKFSEYIPNVGNTPFEYLSETEFRVQYPSLIPTE